MCVICRSRRTLRSNICRHIPFDRIFSQKCHALNALIHHWLQNLKISYNFLFTNDREHDFEQTGIKISSIALRFRCFSRL